MADDYQLTAEFTNDDSNDQESQDTQPMPVEEQSEPSATRRRSTRERRQPEYYHEHTSLCEVPIQPSSYQESIKGPDKAKWQVAMETEMTSLEENEVWDLAKLPADRKAVGSKWVFKIKTGADGSIHRYKARGWLHKALPRSMVLILTKLFVLW